MCPVGVVPIVWYLMTLDITNWKKKSSSNYSTLSKGDKKKARIIYERTKFKNELSHKKKKLWDELPYFGRFDKRMAADLNWQEFIKI